MDITVRLIRGKENDFAAKTSLLSTTTVWHVMPLLLTLKCIVREALIVFWLLQYKGESTGWLCPQKRRSPNGSENVCQMQKLDYV